jgi:hypothetical protein
LGDWKEVSKEWMRQGIIPPPKQFHGPVGMYNRNNYRFENRYGLQREGFRLVRLEALERHHFDGRHEPFDCFEPGCAARFEQPGEWTVHAISTRHDRTAILPKVLAAKTNQREEEIQSMVREYESYWEKLIEECGEEGSAKQQSAKEAFLHQLENDPLYALGVPGTQTYSWDQYCKGMHWNRGYEELLPESSRLLHE